MTTTTRNQVRTSSDLPPFIRKWAERWRRFFAPGDIPALIILIALLIRPPLSLNAAEWPLSLGVIVPITALSATFGLIFSRSRFGELLALIVSSTYGVCLVLLFTAISMEGSVGQNIYAVFEQTIQWLNAVFSDEIYQNDMVFTLLVSVLFWFLGYNAAWHSFRIDRVWRVILPPGLILATNMVFENTDVELDAYMIVFVFLSLLLIARSHLDAREWDWYNRGIRAPRNLRMQFLYIGAILSLIVLGAGLLIPSQDLTDQTQDFREFLNSRPIEEMSEFWNRLFSPVEAAGPTTADYYGGDSLELGGAIRLGEQEVFTVQAPNTGRRYYWRSRVFDTYEAGRWTPASEIRLTDNTAPTDILVENNAARELVAQTYTFSMGASRIIYTLPQPFQVNLATRMDLFYTAPETAQDRAMNVSVIRPVNVIRRGGSYSAASLMSNATADQLRAASITYPEWVVPLYLYVSPSVTQRTRDLAAQIVAEAGAVTPYDQAKAIERYLRLNITYNETIPAPPRGQDPVDWVLFDYQEGYCNYYASSMIVMLRALGIPARMAAGFAQGTWDAERGEYVVTERDAHTWVEVYFPGYGWIEFEPTAAQAELNREGDQQQAPMVEQPVGQNPPTFTPTPSPTPIPTNTPVPTITLTAPPDSDNEQNNPPFTLTPTPTPSPTPSPTPAIVPTQPAPTPPQSSNPFDLVLPALGAFLLILVAFFILLMVAVFIWWWWEWRGMRGLSPVVRAYARLERYIGLIGVQLRDQDTPDERRTEILRVIPQAQRPVNAITRLYASERYGRKESDPAREQRKTEIVDEAWSDARGNILRKWARKFRFWRQDED